MDIRIVQVTAGVILVWILANLFLAGENVDWSNPVLLGILAVFALIALNPLGWVGHRRPSQPPSPPTTEERVGSLEEEMGRHQAEHAWERWLRLLKELFSHEEKRPTGDQGGLLFLGLLGTVVLIGAMFFFGIIPMPSFTTTPTQAPTPSVGQEVVVQSPQVRGYNSLDEAQKGATTFATGWPVGLRLFVKRQAGEFTLACLKGEIACWWFRAADLKPAAPIPTPPWVDTPQAAFLLVGF